MLTVRQKERAWLAMSVTAAVVTANRIYRLSTGSAEWYTLLAAIVILLCCVRFYLKFRRR